MRNLPYKKYILLLACLLKLSLGLASPVAEGSLKEVYEPIGINFTVQVDSSFKIENSVWDIDGKPDNKLKVTGSGAFGVLTNEMRALVNAYKEKTQPDPQTAYLFVLEKSDSAKIAGDMPRGKQFGYLFLDGIKKSEAGQLVAHELGHGLFTLQHSWNVLGDDTKKKTDNLMDYSGGTSLSKFQWDMAHNPELAFDWLKDDGEGMIINYGKPITIHWKTLPSPRLLNGKGALEYFAEAGYEEQGKERTSFFKLTNENIIARYQDPKHLYKEKFIYEILIKDDPAKKWYKFDIDSLPTHCLSCQLESIGKQITIKGVKYGGPVLTIAAGIIAIVTIPQTAGQSLPLYSQFLSLMSGLSGMWMIAGGTIKLTLELDGNSELAKKIPTGFLSGTVGLICLVAVDDEIKKTEISAIVSIIDGVITIDFMKSMDDIGLVLTIIGMTPPTGELIETLADDEKKINEEK